MTDINHQTFHPPSESVLDIPDYPVKIWEVFAVGLGGLALVSAAVFGLANQLFTKMQDSKQAESIAQRVVDYQIPGGSKGLMSLSIGAETFALVGSRNDPSDVLMLITQTAIDSKTTEDPRNFAQELDLQTTLIGAWQSGYESKQTMTFCNQPITVTVRQGQFQMIEPKQTLNAIEYRFEHSQKATLNGIHLLATGKNADKKIQQVFQSLKCRKD
jgi:hypothetical protein